MSARVTQAEFARLCRVNRSTVNRWIKNGRIETDAQGLIDPEAAHKMRDMTESPLPHHQARKAQIEAEKAEDASSAPVPYHTTTQIKETQQAASTGHHGEDQGGEDKDPEKEALRLEMLEISKRTKAARMRNEEATARDKEIDLRLKAGELVWKHEMDAILADYAAADRVLIERFPERWAHEWVALGVSADKAARLLEEMARSTNQEMADHAAMRAEQSHAS